MTCHQCLISFYNQEAHKKEENIRGNQIAPYIVYYYSPIN